MKVFIHNLFSYSCTLPFLISFASYQRFYLAREKSYLKSRMDKLVANIDALKTNEVHVDAQLMMHQITLCSAILLNFN